MAVLEITGGYFILAFLSTQGPVNYVDNFSQ